MEQAKPQESDKSVTNGIEDLTVHETESTDVKGGGIGTDHILLRIEGVDGETLDR